MSAHCPLSLPLRNTHILYQNQTCEAFKPVHPPVGVSELHLAGSSLILPGRLLGHWKPHDDTAHLPKISASSPPANSLFLLLSIHSRIRVAFDSCSTFWEIKLSAEQVWKLSDAVFQLNEAFSRCLEIGIFHQKCAMCNVIPVICATNMLSHFFCFASVVCDVLSHNVASLALLLS